jgi:hypothetical protein
MCAPRAARNERNTTMNKRHASLPFILAFAIGAGCHGEPEPGGGGVSLDPECAEEYDARASAVLASVNSCSSDADCIIARSSPGCISPFLCSTAIGRGNDAAYEDAASQLVEDYIAECGNFCSVADCVGPEQLRALCDTTIGRCTIEVLPFESSAVSEP